MPFSGKVENSIRLSTNKAENVQLLKELVLENRGTSIREADNIHFTIAQPLDSV